MADEHEEKSQPEAAEETEEQKGLHTTVERTGPCEVVIRIEAEADYLADRYHEELGKLQGEVTLHGFRRGQAPVALVERRLGSSLRSDVISSALTEAYEKAVEDSKLRVVTEVEAPDLEELDWMPGQPAEFAFRCEVMPTVEVQEGQYKGLSVEVPALRMTEELLAREMERFARQFATWEKVTTPGIDWDDYVEATLAVPAAGWTGKAEFYPRQEKVGPFEVEGLKGALVSAQVGDEIELEGTLAAKGEETPEGLRDLPEGATQLNLTVQAVMRNKVPTLDDELARKLGMESLDDIQAMVRERVEAALSARKDEIARAMAVRKVSESVELQLPDTLVERASREQQARLLIRMLRAGVPREQAEERADQASDQTRQAVVETLKKELLLHAIAERERIFVTESEVDEQVRAFASRQGWREERARSYLEEHGIVRSLREDMREGKTLGFLVENAEVTEVPLDEFNARYGPREAEPEE